MIHAATGIIMRADGGVFFQQRLSPQSRAGYWEFPGGKVNEGETVYAALCRELHEEIGIKVKRARHFVRRQHKMQNGGDLLLDFYIIEQYTGIPHDKENQPFCWRTIDSPPQPLLSANINICKYLRLPPLYAITAAAIFGVAPTLHKLRTLLATGQISCVQLRDKHLSPAERYDFAKQAATCCRQYGALLLINDDEDLANAVAADGVHLSSKKLRECCVRPKVEWVGASCHTAAEIALATKLAADFAVLSPITKTLSHVNTPLLGWQKFGEIAISSSIPLYALGGLRTTDIPKAWSHNACGVASMRAIWED